MRHDTNEFCILNIAVSETGRKPPVVLNFKLISAFWHCYKQFQKHIPTHCLCVRVMYFLFANLLSVTGHTYSQTNSVKPKHTRIAETHPTHAKSLILLKRSPNTIT